MNELILLPIDTSGRRGKATKRSMLGSAGQSSRLHGAEVRFGGVGEASFVLDPVGRLGLFVKICNHC